MRKTRNRPLSYPEGVVPEEIFHVFNGAWLKVAIGKGICSWERVEFLADRYSVYF